MSRVLTSKSSKLTAIEACKALAAYFEIKEESFKFWLQQMKNSGKI